MSVDTYEQMTTGVSDITSIALVTLEIINNTLLINELSPYYSLNLRQKTLFGSSYPLKIKFLLIS